LLPARDGGSEVADMPAHRPGPITLQILQTSQADAAQTSGLENGQSTAHVCRMEENTALTVVGAIIALVAIYSLWALRRRK